MQKRTSPCTLNLSATSNNKNTATTTTKSSSGKSIPRKKQRKSRIKNVVNLHKRIQKSNAKQRVSNKNNSNRKKKRDLNEVEMLKSNIMQLEYENKRLRRGIRINPDTINMQSSGNSSKSSASTTSNTSGETSSYDKDFDKDGNKQMISVDSLMPNAIVEDNDTNRNLLVAININEDDDIYASNPEFVGMLEKIKIQTKSYRPKNTNGRFDYTSSLSSTTTMTEMMMTTMEKIEDRTRVDIMYHESTKALFFSINLQYYSNGLYKFILKANTDKGLIESNRVDFQILSPEEEAEAAAAAEQNNKDNDDDDDDDDDFNHFDHFDSNDHFGDRNGEDHNPDDNNNDNNNDFFNDDFSNGDFDMMFDNYKDTENPKFNRYFIFELLDYSSSEVDDGEVADFEDNDDDDDVALPERTNRNTLPDIIDNFVNNTISTKNLMRNNNTSNSSVTQKNIEENIEENIGNNDDNNMDENDAFTAIVIENNESASKRLLNAPTYLMVLLLALILGATMSRTQDNNQRDPVLKYSSIMVEKLGITKLSTNVCSYLTSMDCTEHVQYISNVPIYQKTDFYPVVREPMPHLALLTKKCCQILTGVIMLCYFCLFPDNYYMRDRFANSGMVFMGINEMLRTYFDGHPIVLMLPMIGPLICYYLLEHIVLEKYFTRETLKQYRVKYNTITVFIWYLTFFPAREWFVLHYGKESALTLPPCTILYALPLQRIFSQPVAFVLATRIKGYFPFDWYVVLFISAFVVTLASSFARTYNDGTENMNTFIINCCQIFPYYVAPLLFTGTIMTIMKPVFWLARDQYEGYTGNRWDRCDNMYC